MTTNKSLIYDCRLGIQCYIYKIFLMKIFDYKTLIIETQNYNRYHYINIFLNLGCYTIYKRAFPSLL